MARDDAARESGSEKRLLDRRAYLKMAGAAAAAAAAVNAADSAKGAPGRRTDAPAREATGSDHLRKLVVDGTDHPDSSADYRFEVSGTIRAAGARDSDESAGEASGRVAGEAVTYLFSGRVTGFDLDGPADVRITDRA